MNEMFDKRFEKYMRKKFLKLSNIQTLKDYFTSVHFLSHNMHFMVELSDVPIRLIEIGILNQFFFDFSPLCI